MNNSLRSLVLIILFLLVYTNGIAQYRKASNIFFRTMGDNIEIFYDLPRNTDTLEIRAYFRKKSDPKIKYRLKRADGSIGVGRFSGKKQKIVWHYKKEPVSLFTGSGFYYEIIVNKIVSAQFNN